MFDTEDVGVFLGLDVGKSAHHGHGLTPAGKKVFDKQLPNSEPKLRAVFDKLAKKFGTVLVIVDQPASIGALPLTVARDAGCQVAYLPGLAMRRIADLYPGDTGFGLLAGDAVPVTVVGGGHRVDREHFPLARPQHCHQQAPGRLDGHRDRVLLGVAVFGEQVQQQLVAGRVVADVPLGQ